MYMSSNKMFDSQQRAVNRMENGIKHSIICTNGGELAKTHASNYKADRTLNTYT